MALANGIPQFSPYKSLIAPSSHPSLYFPPSRPSTPFSAAGAPKPHRPWLPPQPPPPLGHRTSWAGASDELERIFNKFDSNEDCKVSSSELAMIFESLGHPASDKELERMMSKADADGDVFISFDEFVNLNVRTIDDSAALEDLHHAFSIFDLDRNGAISVDELARVLRSIGEGASVAQCKRMIDGVDHDCDGLVSFEEFKL